MRTLFALAALLVLASCGGSAADGLTGVGCINTRGDVDGNGQIGPADAGITEEIVSGAYSPSSCESEAADYDGDGQVTTADADAIFAAYLDS